MISILQAIDDDDFTFVSFVLTFSDLAIFKVDRHFFSSPPWLLLRCPTTWHRPMLDGLIDYFDKHRNLQLRAFVLEILNSSIFLLLLLLLWLLLLLLLLVVVVGVVDHHPLEKFLLRGK